MNLDITGTLSKRAQITYLMEIRPVVPCGRTDTHIETDGRMVGQTDRYDEVPSLLFLYFLEQTYNIQIMKYKFQGLYVKYKFRAKIPEFLASQFSAYSTVKSSLFENSAMNQNYMPANLLNIEQIKYTILTFEPYYVNFVSE
jgi:hypothetical protein